MDSQAYYPGVGANTVPGEHSSPLRRNKAKPAAIPWNKEIRNAYGSERATGYFFITSYYGKGFGDNGKYIAQELHRQRPDIRIYWQTDDCSSLPEMCIRDRHSPSDAAVEAKLFHAGRLPDGELIEGIYVMHELSLIHI